MGGWLLQALFFETTLSDRPHVKFTLKDQDHAGYPSLYRLYMETNDPTEYIFATQYLGGWEHWERLCECSWFQPYVTRWRKELDLRFRAHALQNIRAIADSDAKDKLTANKILLSYAPKGEAKGRGRPSKAEVQQEAKRMAQEQRNLKEDFERIGGGLN